MRVLVVIALLVVASPASAQPAMVEREDDNACAEMPRLPSMAVHLAARAGIDHHVGELWVRRGELLWCAPTCLALGQVVRADSEPRTDSDGTVTLEVVPAARPTWLETWVLGTDEDGPFVHAVGRRPRRALDLRRELHSSSIASEGIDRRWRARATDDAGLAPLRDLDVQIEGVRTAHGWLDVLTHRDDSGAVVMLRGDDGTLTRTCGVHVSVSGPIHLSDVVNTSPLGDDVGAVFVRMTIHAQGYAYDQGYETELWAFVPQSDGQLRWSSVAIGNWSGSERDEGGSEWVGWARTIRTVGPDALSLGPSERQHFREPDGPGTRTMLPPLRHLPPPTPTEVRFDSSGFALPDTPSTLSEPSSE